MTIHHNPLSRDQLNALQRSGELSPGQCGLIEVVQHFVGSNLDHNGDELRRFISRDGIDNPKTLLDKHVSDCGLFALAVWHELGVDHKLLAEPYVTGMAIAWCHTIAHDLQAVRHPIADGPPTVGALMHYYTNDKDSHVEFCLSDVSVFDSVWVAYHAGGGRTNCGIGRDNSNIKWNWGRPLQEWYDLGALLQGVDYETDYGSNVPIRPQDLDVRQGARLASKE